MVVGARYAERGEVIIVLQERTVRIIMKTLRMYTVGKARVYLLLPRIFPCYFMNIL